jgi:hypothetical protein
LISHPIEATADVAFKHICQLGLEGIVSKKIGSRYESGRSSLWLKTLNPNAPALQRLEQEELARIDRATTWAPTTFSGRKHVRYSPNSGA